MSDTALLNLGAWSIQVAALALAAAVLARLVRIDAPAVRHAWWRGVLVLALVLPLLQPWRPAGEEPPAAVALGAESVVPADVPAAPVRLDRAAAAVPAGPISPPPWGRIVAAVLAGGALLRLAWLAAGMARLRRIRSYGTRAADRSDQLQALFDAGADVRYVASLGQPITFGVVRPVVLLPGAVASMPEGVRRAVLTHELWHVRRRDWLWSFAEELLCAALWFHPAIWYLVSRVQGAREEVVDELSIRSTRSRRTYLEALLAFADEPAMCPAAPFIRRRQLFNRMMLISREGVMSPKRILASSAAMAGALALTGWYCIGAFPLTAAATAAPAAVVDQQPRDPRPGTPGRPTAREADLRAAATTDPSIVKTWLELAQLQEARGAMAEAEGTLRSALAATSGSRPVGLALAQFFMRQGQFDSGVAVLESLAAHNPGDASGHQLVATYYAEKVQKDQRLTRDDKLKYIDAGIRAGDRALAQHDDYVEALTYKSILLRMKAGLEAEPARRQELLDEADALRARAMALGTRPTSRPATVPAGYPPPPPPPPPPAPPAWYWLDGQRPVRIDADAKGPAKLHHVYPVYPREALDAGLAGTVVVEAAIDTEGAVRGTRIVRSAPGFDEAAAAAVSQWRFEPTVIEGKAVPVLVNVTVTFSVR